MTDYSTMKGSTPADLPMKSSPQTNLTMRSSTPADLIIKGSTRTDLIPNRAPADTPRGRLHRAATAGIKTARRASQIVALTPNMGRLHRLAQRGAELLAGDLSRKALLITALCQGLDQALEALVPLIELDLPWMCEEMISTLAQLELSEHQAARLKGEVTGLKQGLMFERDQNKELRTSLTFERDQNEQLRAALAAEKIRSAAALRDIPADRFDEPTRSLAVTLRDISANRFDEPPRGLDFLTEETRVLDDPEAPLGGPTFVGIGTGPPRKPHKRA